MNNNYLNKTTTTKKRLLTEDDLNKSLDSNVRNETRNQFGSFNKSNKYNSLTFTNDDNFQNHDSSTTPFTVNKFRRTNQLTFSSHPQQQQPITSTSLKPPTPSLNFKTPTINNNNTSPIKSAPQPLKLKLKVPSKTPITETTTVKQEDDFDFGDIDFDFNDIPSNENVNNIDVKSEPISPTKTATTTTTGKGIVKKKNTELDQLFGEFFESPHSSSQNATTTGGSSSQLNQLFSNRIQQPEPTQLVGNKEIKEKVENELFQRFALLLENSIINIHLSDKNESKLLDIPESIPLVLRKALLSLKYQKLYSHQLECRDYVNQGSNIIITTPTSSGKSLCISLPIFETIVNFKLSDTNNSKKSPTALFLFPLKALANDQIQSITTLNNALDSDCKLLLYSISGDTNKYEIPRIFNNKDGPDILLSNPDWIHYQLFRGGNSVKGEDKQWIGWKNWFSRLKFIVLDEIHTYSGVMGCHFINLLRRMTNYHKLLNCDSEIYEPLQFLMASATIGNPREMALKMISQQDNPNVRINLIDKSGSGSHGKTFLTLKTPKNHSYSLPSLVMHHWIQLGIKGIVFCNSIKSLNSLLQYFTSESKHSNNNGKFIKPYYSSLSNDHKKETLDQLKSGQVKIILSTNALEAGVDISELDACLIIGYPGSKMSWKQRVGRVGRSKPGLVVYIPDSYSPMDKYYSRNPLLLFEGEPEPMSFNGNFPTILKSHILCASSEIGIPCDYEYLKENFGPISESVLNQLLAENRIQVNQDQFGKLLWISSGHHHISISIRGGSGTSDIVKIKLESSSNNQNSPTKYNRNNFNNSNSNLRIIEQVTKLQAITRFFPGSIFISYHGGYIQSYQVKELDISSQNGGDNYALVKPFYPPKNTKIITHPNKYGCVEMTRVLDSKEIPLLNSTSGLKLRVSFGVGSYTTIVDSFETRTCLMSTASNNSNNLFSDEDTSLSKFESEFTQLKNKLEIGYEAPCIEFTFTGSIKPLLQGIFDRVLDELRSKLSISPTLPRKEYEMKLLDLKEHGITLVSLHTIVHQILSAFPMLSLSSKSEIEESFLSLSKGSALSNSSSNIIRNSVSISSSPSNSSKNSKNSLYLVDNVEGGSGSCQDLFDNIHLILEKAIELSFCPNCYENRNINLTDEFGCVLCLHSTHCKNKALLKSLGVLNLDLKNLT